MSWQFLILEKKELKKRVADVKKPSIYLLFSLCSLPNFIMEVFCPERERERERERMYYNRQMNMVVFVTSLNDKFKCLELRVGMGDWNNYSRVRASTTAKCKADRRLRSL
jgi:hypothetical protein